MARKKTPNLTEAELRLMKVVWDLKEASVNDVLVNLPEDYNLAYNTVLTTMRILEQKGYLKYKDLIKYSKEYGQTDIITVSRENP